MVKEISRIRRAVTQLTKDNTFINMYDSLYDAEIATKVQRRNIYKVCEGLRETAGGFVWRDSTKNDRTRRASGL